MNEKYENVPMENYLELAVAIISAAISDYVQGKWWINNNPWREDFTQKESEEWFSKNNQYLKDIASTVNFLNSGRFEMFVKGNKDIKGYLLDNMDKVAAIGKTVVLEGEEKEVDEIFLNTAVRILTDRVREVVF